MKSWVFGLGSWVVLSILLAAQTPNVAQYPIQPVPLKQVTLTDGFWKTRLETNRTVTIPHILDQNEKTGRVDNLRKGAGQMPGEYQGRRFNDTDIYKIIEAASYSLATHPDPVLAKSVDDLITLIEKNQQPDGYLFPARTINPARPAAGIGSERWEYENTGSHETYNSGHLIEAAVAHYAATGKRTLFDVAIRNANLLASVFGPKARQDAPGHEEVELALFRLYRATGDARYRDLARFFVDQRGTNHTASKDYTEPSWQLYNDRAYRQDDKPVLEQAKGQGHAVRAVYLYSAITDIAALQNDPKFLAAAERLWQDIASKRMYLTGGLGSVGGTEAFADDYVLPNRTAYTETCASVGGMLWYHRLFLKTGEAKYLDTFEQTLYNGYLSGVSIKGDSFFYQNPLEANAQSRNNQRSAYFDVACCPANLARLMAQVPELIYAQRGNEVFVNLFINSEAKLKIGDANVTITQQSNYPWDGRVSVTLRSDRPVRVPLRIRVPGWASAGPLGTDLYRFDSPSTPTRYGTMDALIGPAQSGWLERDIDIKPGGFPRVNVMMDMPVRRVLPHDGIKENAGKAAIQRGPLVYALEGADNDGKVLDIVAPLATQFTPVERK
ncbi:MAG TPA: beta-L-arabinofuranosidase domain-containing protein, partial [Vicinamibacterales bacterium]|nr:beta-L-arabinofuranosidase domain-containing protein [Vicinamibacterales bacterium]